MIQGNKPEPGSKEQGDFSPPAISLQKGGGAIRGIGEKFAANPVTGTGSLTVPIFTSPGRAGFGPQLSLSYDSGAGNGPFGFGWSLSFPSITRKTDKGLPLYRDAAESDVFILSGSEDLVPVFKTDRDGKWVFDEEGNHLFHEDARDGYLVRRFRPRIEGLFARIERWTSQSDPTDIRWKSISKDNVTTWYGKSKTSRIYDPGDQTRIFSWLICESYDDKGNALVYEYQKENSDGVNLFLPNERNRSRGANRYIKSIKYGNKTSRLVQPDLSKMEWLFEVVFDYLSQTDGANGEEFGQHYHLLPADEKGQLLVEASLDTPRTWGVRRDPYSSYRSGFEVRTYRLCRRVLMFHHFKKEELRVKDYLVRSTEFSYSDSPVASFITSIRQSGYVLRDDDKYLKKSLPRLEFDYSQADIDGTIREIDAESLENLPSGVDGFGCRWVDLDGEGIVSILSEQAGGWYYKRNLSPINRGAGGGAEYIAPQLGPVELVATRPNALLSTGRAQFLDLAGDGQLDLAELSGVVPGFYERTPDQGWEQFRSFESLPNILWNDPNLRFVDLTGDGHADILITEEHAFTWYASCAEAGFDAAERISQPLDEEQGPALVFADNTQSIYLADLSGDGLTDLVRIRNGEICYWPNLGYGRFGKKVTMDKSPWFDAPDLFDQKRVRLADIDGSGTTDILYLNHDRVAVWRNECGNGWSAPEYIDNFPPIDDLSSVVAIDLLGNGTACLVWSSPMSGDVRRPMRYIDLMKEGKPHLLKKMVNNLGAETRVEYAPSTKFYLQDKRDGRPWITRLPFPVHVVERVETYDWISRNRFVTRYAYHHGYFDGIEREFRGFGKVEQWDTEEFATLGTSDQFLKSENSDASSHVPPVRTVTWFHTGAFIGQDRIGDKISRQMAHEYYGVPIEDDADFANKWAIFESTLLPDTIMPTDLLLRDGSRDLTWTLTTDELREAARALKGSILRQEIYAEDKSPKAPHPYAVSERNYTIECLQSRGTINRHAVFFAHPRETIDCHYERNPADPRIRHALTLEVDGYGNVLKSVAVGYGRITSDLAEEPDRIKQTATLITCTENRFTTPIDDPSYPDDYRTPLPCETRTHELTGSDLSCGSVRFTLEDLRDDASVATPILYEQAPDSNLQKRLLECVCTLYRRNDLSGPSALGEVQSLALPYETYKLVLTAKLATTIFIDRNSNPGKPTDAELGDVLSKEGGYVQWPGDAHSKADEHWWLPSGKTYLSPIPEPAAAVVIDDSAYARQHFFLPHAFEDPWGNLTRIEYDDYDLLPVETRDALDNIVTVRTMDDHGASSLRLDYRVLQPYWITDPNGNRTAVAFDALGLVVGTAVMGKPSLTASEGDSLENFAADSSRAQIDAFFDNPCEAGPSGASSVASQTARDLLASSTTRIIYDFDRFANSGEPAFAATLARQTHVSDLASGEETGIQISFTYSDGFGREIQKKIQAEPGPVPPGGPAINPRWVSSGWTVFNNKGKPVRQYEPFFSTLPDKRHQFEFARTEGVSQVLFYDPVGRVVATLYPNNTYEKVVFDPWQQIVYDMNDTVAWDPRTDADIQRLVAAYFASRAADWETWLQQRVCDPAHPPSDTQGQNPEQDVAVRTLAHADTPTIIHFDTLGRAFMTVADNGQDNDQNPAQPAQHRLFPTRVLLDIEGNEREVRDAIVQNSDAQGRIVMRYDYDMLGKRIHQASMEAGERWMLNDVNGKPVRAWDSRGHVHRIEYDELRRPVRQFVRGTDAAQSDPRTLGRELLHEKIVYGEGQADDIALNLRTRVFKRFDTAGVVTNMGRNPVTDRDEAYDFKGNLRRNVRAVADDYKKLYDWAVDAMQPTWEMYSTSTRYDALNRPVELTAPHASGSKSNTTRLTYNEANLLNAVETNLREETGIDGKAVWTSFVANIDYDAKGQRTLIQYGNGATTRYEYDPLTFRLTRLTTARGKQGETAPDCSVDFDPRTCIDPPDACPQVALKKCGLQDLNYTYDPAGNITHIRDDARQVIYFRQRRVDASNDYIYDALYRLIRATGREHLGQSANGLRDPLPWSNDDAPRIGLPHPNDGNAMGRYTERYLYDAVGNILKMAHQADGPSGPPDLPQNPGWTRSYQYLEAGLIEAATPAQPAKTSNRLTSTALGQEISPSEHYSHDPHGNMIAMPHLPRMDWDFKDQLQTTQRQAVSNGSGEKTCYVYDSNGQRVRKVTERANGNPKDERIYLGGFEVYRNHSGTTAGLVRETLHIMDDKQRIALVETRNDVNDGSPQQLIRYQFGNHIGLACLELDDKALVISYEEYTPYGSTSYQAVRSQTETPKGYRYTAKERDEESGFYYHGARYYAPWLGRWTRYDPAYMKSGPNLYEYVLNNPVRFYDPDGASAGELADKWANVSIFGWTPGSYIPGLTGEKVVAAAEHFMDRAIGAALDAQPKGTGLVASAQRLGAEVGATVLKTAGTVLVNIVAGAFIDPGYAARGVMHLGEGAAAGYENVKKGNIAVGVSQIVGDVSSAVLTVTPAIKGGLSLARRIPTGAPKGVSPTAKPAGGEGSPLEHITDEEIERAVQEEPKSGTLEKTPAKSDKQVRAEKEAAHKTQKKAWEEAGRENRSIAQQNWLFEKYGIWDVEEHSMGGDLGPGAGCWGDEIQPPRPGYDLVPSGDKTMLVRKAQ